MGGVVGPFKLAGMAYLRRFEPEAALVLLDFSRKASAKVEIGECSDVCSYENSFDGGVNCVGVPVVWSGRG
jgi:hypothetical protein